MHGFANASVELTLHRSSGVPLTRQICETWRSAIAAGTLSAGHVLPSSRALALELGVSRNTVAAAVAQLVAEGYLVVSQGRRPVVAARLTLGRSGSGRATRAAPPRLSRWADQLARDPWPFADSRHPRPFQPGLADGRLFPHEIWARCLRRAARRRTVVEAGPLSRPSLQGALSRHLAEWRGVRADPEQVIVLPSAQSALNLLARCLLDPGEVAWVEDPGYPGARAAFVSAGAKVRGIALDADGLCLPDDGAPPRLIFTTPSHQYPTGRLMPVSRRQELLDFAADVRAAVVEDDYDGAFHYDTRPVVALQGLGHEHDVFYVGTFSKTMRPDIRIGYAVVPRAYAPIVAAAQRHAGLIVPATVQQALAEFIDDGYFGAHIRRMNRIYQARRDCIVEGLMIIDGGVRLRMTTPAGGMQIPVEFDRAIDDVEVSRTAAALGLTARPLSHHFITQPPRSGLFLGFAAWDEAEIDAGLRLLREAFRRVIDRRR